MLLYQRDLGDIFRFLEFFCQVQVISKIGRAQLTNPHDQLSHSHGAVDVDYFVGHPILEINIKFYVKMILSYPFFININIYFEG